MRIIVQLTVDLIGRVHVLDNNGAVWRLEERRDDTGTGAMGYWVRLPALPSIDAPRTAAGAGRPVKVGTKACADFLPNTSGIYGHLLCARCHWLFGDHREDPRLAEKAAELQSGARTLSSASSAPIPHDYLYQTSAPISEIVDRAEARTAAAVSCSSCGDRGGSFGLKCPACGRDVDSIAPPASSTSAE